MDKLPHYFLQLRQKADPVKEFLSPESVTEAYQIQHKNILTTREPISAWKLGGTTKSTRDTFQTASLFYGPIFASSIYSYSESIKLDPKFREPKGELELSFKLSSAVNTLTSEKLKNDKVFFNTIQSLYASVELPWSAFPLPEAGLKVLIADYCASGALILGNELPWRENLIKNLSCDVYMKTKSTLLAQGSLSQIIEGPLEALRGFLFLALEQKIPLKAGQIVASGGVSKCVNLPLDEEITVDFNQLDQFKFLIKS
jgi:2-keto-4-pentenoate hydratase